MDLDNEIYYLNIIQSSQEPYPFAVNVNLKIR
jgi:hypothetical protein